MMGWLPSRSDTIRVLEAASRPARNPANEQISASRFSFWPGKRMRTVGALFWFKTKTSSVPALAQGAGAQTNRRQYSLLLIAKNPVTWAGSRPLYNSYLQNSRPILAPFSHLTTAVFCELSDIETIIRRDGIPSVDFIRTCAPFLDISRTVPSMNGSPLSRLRLAKKKVGNRGSRLWSLSGYFRFLSTPPMSRRPYLSCFE